MTTQPESGDEDGAGAVGEHGSGEPDRALVRDATVATIKQLQRGYQQDVAMAVGAVARLRREAGRPPHASPASWGLDHMEELTKRRYSELEEPASDSVIEREDTAVHLAVTLWALHQQSVRDQPMHDWHWPLGRAVRQLGAARTGAADSGVSVEEFPPTIRKRFVRIGTASDIETLGGRLRDMVTLLRAERIPLDYGRLASQLLEWQYEHRQGDVRRAWGREFHRAESAPASNDQPTDDD